MNDTMAEYLPQLDGWRAVLGCGRGLRAMWQGISKTIVRYHRIQYREVSSYHKEGRMAKERGQRPRRV